MVEKGDCQKLFVAFKDCVQKQVSLDSIGLLSLGEKKGSIHLTLTPSLLPSLSCLFIYARWAVDGDAHYGKVSMVIVTHFLT